MNTGMEQEILVVDDYGIGRDVTRLILEKAGYGVLTAADWSVAIQQVELHGAGLKLVLLDMLMPGLNGEQTFQVIRALQADLPCLVFSGFYEAEAFARMQGLGRLDFLAKPVYVDELVAKVARMLARHPRTGPTTPPRRLATAA